MSNAKHTLQGFEAGVALACKQAAITPEALLEKVAFTKEATTNVLIQSSIAKIACNIFSLAGEGFEKEAAFYANLSNKTRPVHKYCRSMFIEPVLEVLQKEASIGAFSALASALKSGLGKTFGILAASPEKLSLLGALGGLGIGGLTWALNRDINQEDIETEAKLEQARHYRKIADDIKRSIDLKSAGSAETKELKQQLKDESDASYVL